MTSKKPEHPEAQDPLPAEWTKTLLHDVPDDLSNDDAGARRVRARMWQKIERSLRQETTQYVTVRSGEGAWVPLFPLVEMKLLHSICKSASFLLRLQPGARLPSHEHLAAEECVMLEGELDLGDGLIIRAGDYHLAPASLSHGTAVSRSGALIFIRSEDPAYQL
jgi:hypothetical protein